MKLVEQLTLVTLQTAHHGSTSPRIASTQRNHASRPVSTDFCNKICHKRKPSSDLSSARSPLKGGHWGWDLGQVRKGQNRTLPRNTILMLLIYGLTGPAGS